MWCFHPGEIHHIGFAQCDPTQRPGPETSTSEATCSASTEGVVGAGIGGCGWVDSARVVRMKMGQPSLILCVGIWVANVAHLLWLLDHPCGQ